MIARVLVIDPDPARLKAPVASVLAEEERCTSRRGWVHHSMITSHSPSPVAVAVAQHPPTPTTSHLTFVAGEAHLPSLLAL